MLKRINNQYHLKDRSLPSLAFEGNFNSIEGLISRGFQPMDGVTTAMDCTCFVFTNKSYITRLFALFTKTNKKKSI